MTKPATGPSSDESTSVLAKAPFRVGTVTLIVRDLAALARYYRDVIGLTVIEQTAASVSLGAGAKTLVVLRQDPFAPLWGPQDAGLFHTAFLLPSRGDLGSSLWHAEALGVSLTGAADHLVSEAVYLSDPEGNGIEIYVDRPDAEWRHAVQSWCATNASTAQGW